MFLTTQKIAENMPANYVSIPFFIRFCFLELADGISRDADWVASTGCHASGLATVLHKPSKATESAE